MALTTTLMVVAKAPVPGRVKTRLCPPCDAVEAAAIAEAALADTLDAVGACGADRRVLALDGEPGPWLPPGFRVVPQVDGPLAVRLAAAWSGMAGPTLQLGMDTPQVDAALLDAGLAALTRESRAVLGPAYDGGWWAIGMRHPEPRVFDGVPMSTSGTGAAQLAALWARGLEPELLAARRDIDSFADAVAVAAAIPGSRTARRVRVVVDRMAA